jgi:acid phosphatase type 7
METALGNVRRRYPLRMRAVAAFSLIALALAACLGPPQESSSNHLLITSYPSSAVPDQIALGWPDDPATSLSIHWRTSAGEPAGELRYRPVGTPGWQTMVADTMVLEALMPVNDRKVARHIARLRNLSPGTTYQYQISHADGWLDIDTFTTAPSEMQPFSFLYLGDSQKIATRQQFPLSDHTAFALHAGDLVDQGCYRQEWDAFFHHFQDLMRQIPIMPAIGNHDICNDRDPHFYTLFFDLPENGSDALPKEQSYHFSYGNALVAVLNSNHKIKEQAQWLDQVLEESDAQWKFLLWHHPAYSSRRGRDNRLVRHHWVTLAEKHGVDIVFQGHDHAYARSKPLLDGKVARDGEHGIIYTIAVSGPKHYEQEDSHLFATGQANISTYQMIHIEGGELRYEAYDTDHNLIDWFSLSKEK